MIRASEAVTPLFSDLWYQCQDIACGHTWKAALSFVHTISPSAKPRMDLPSVALPAPDNDADPPGIDPPLSSSAA